MILCVLEVIREMHTCMLNDLGEKANAFHIRIIGFFRSDDLYVRLLSDMIVLWSSPTVNAEQQAFLTNIFIVLFDIDCDFLYDCYKLMDREVFSELLVVLETALSFTPIGRIGDEEFGLSPKVCPLNFCFLLCVQNL